MLGSAGWVSRGPGPERGGNVGSVHQSQGPLLIPQII